MVTSKLINGDSAEQLKKLDDNSVDLLCTDPPYGYGFMGKSWDTHCPFGPYIVTSDEIDDPHNLNLRTYVNDEERQNTNTNLMIFQ